MVYLFPQSAKKQISMFIQYIIDLFLSFVFDRFAPKIGYAKRIPEARDPTRLEDGSLGYDLYTPVEIVLMPGTRKTIDTGIVFDMPPYMGMFIWDKSSMARNGLSVCGGVVDPSYRGTVGVILENCSQKNKIIIKKGLAIAQAVFHIAIRPKIMTELEDNMTETDRGERGFGGDLNWKEWTRESLPNDP